MKRTLALIKDNAIVDIVVEGGRVRLPGTKTFIDPAEDGWEGYGYRLAAIVPFDLTGKQILSGPTIGLVGGVPRQLYEVEDAPPARPRVAKTTVHDRLHAAGKLEAAKAMLEAHAIFFVRWFSPDPRHTYVYSDDPDAIALLNAIDADPDIILAPEE